LSVRLETGDNSSVIVPTVPFADLKDLCSPSPDGIRDLLVGKQGARGTIRKYKLDNHLVLLPSSFLLVASSFLFAAQVWRGLTVFLLEPVRQMQSDLFVESLPFEGLQQLNPCDQHIESCCTSERVRVND